MADIVTTYWKENMILESDNPNKQTVLMESSPDFEGTNSGLSPKALMLSSIGGCTGLDILSLFKKMRIEVDAFNIVVNGELTDEHPKYYHKVAIDYHFKGTDLKEDKITKAVNLSIDRYCGVLEMFRRFAEIKTNIHFHKA